jgi:hypothetical protein
MARHLPSWQVVTSKSGMSVLCRCYTDGKFNGEIDEWELAFEQPLCGQLIVAQLRALADNIEASNPTLINADLVRALHLAKAS